MGQAYNASGRCSESVKKEAFQSPSPRPNTPLPDGRQTLALHHLLRLLHITDKRLGTEYDD